MSIRLSQSFFMPHSPFSKFIRSLKNVTEDNARLSRTLIDASVKIALYEEAERENLRLRSILGFEPPVAYMLEPARFNSIAGNYIPCICGHK